MEQILTLYYLQILELNRDNTICLESDQTDVVTSQLMAHNAVKKISEAMRL